MDGLPFILALFTVLATSQHRRAALSSPRCLHASSVDTTISSTGRALGVTAKFKPHCRRLNVAGVSSFVDTFTTHLFLIESLLSFYPHVLKSIVFCCNLVNFSLCLVLAVSKDFPYARAMNSSSGFFPLMECFRTNPFLWYPFGLTAFWWYRCTVVS